MVNPCDSKAYVTKKLMNIDLFMYLFQEENWVSNGFHKTDQYKDWKRMHVAAFGFISVISCWYMIFILYRPDQ